MFFLENSISSIISDASRSLAAWICEFVYGLIITLCNLFNELSLVSFWNNTMVKTIYNRVGLILSIYMLFRTLFWLIQLLIDPDKVADKEKGVFNLVKRAVIMVVMLALAPSVFNVMAYMQSRVIESNIIPRILLVNNFDDSNNFGTVLASELLFTFFADDYSPLYVDDPGLSNLKKDILRKEKIFNLQSYVNVDEGGFANSGYAIEFDSLFAIVVGLFTCWMLLVYCLDVAVRAVQLIFLKLIAPIPIMSYLTPNKESVFTRWTKQVITTYLDLFIRLIILNFIVVLCSSVISGGTFEYIGNLGSITKVLIVLGLLLFLNRAPKLVQELIGKPNAASLGYGPMGASGSLIAGTALGAGIGVAGGALGGFATGGIRGAISGATGGLIGGTARGLSGGMNAQPGQFGKSADAIMKKQVRANRMNNMQRAMGMNAIDRFKEDIAHNTGGLGYMEKTTAKVNYGKKVKETLQGNDRVRGAEAAFSSVMTDASSRYAGMSMAQMESQLAYDSLGNAFMIAERDADGNFVMEQYDTGRREMRSLGMDENGSEMFEEVAVMDKRIKRKQATIGEVKANVDEAYDIAYREDYKKISNMINNYNRLAGTNFDINSRWTDYKDANGNEVKGVKSHFNADKAADSRIGDGFVGPYGGRMK